MKEKNKCEEIFSIWIEMLNNKNYYLKQLVHCYDNANFPIAFSSEDNFF